MPKWIFYVNYFIIVGKIFMASIIRRIDINKIQLLRDG